MSVIFVPADAVDDIPGPYTCFLSLLSLFPCLAVISSLLVLRNPNARQHPPRLAFAASTARLYTPSDLVGPRVVASRQPCEPETIG